MRALDLFSCAGGSARGLQSVGFHVTGVDIVKQRRYAGNTFVQTDALSLGIDFIRTFDFVWASPPCQSYSAMRHAPGAVGAPKLIGPVREMLRAAGRPYVIENVVGSDLIAPILLCGSHFGLGCQGHQLQRHRLFECSFDIEAPACAHTNQPVVGVYGGHARRRSAAAGGRLTADVWIGGHKTAASEALGIDWPMSLEEMSECIPPAYARFIGEAFLVTRRSAAA